MILTLKRLSILVLLLVVGTIQRATAQFNALAQPTITYDSAKVLLTSIARSYEIDTLQRMNIYSSLFMTDSPSVKIDSLVSNYYLKGRSVFARLDNAVFLRNDHWSISVLNDVQEIYVDSVQNDDKLNLKANPLQMADTMYYDPENTYMLQSQNDTAVLTVHFGNNAQLTEAILVFNRRTARLYYAQYVIPMLIGEDVEATSSYILKMIFDEPYADESAASVFDERKYILFDDSNVPHGAGIYKNYKVTASFEPPVATSLP